MLSPANNPSGKSTPHRLTVRRSAGHPARRVQGNFARPVCAAAVALLLACGGCGTSVNDLLFQTGTAVGRTFLDLLLTDVANTLEDQLDSLGQPADGDDQDTDDAGAADDDGDGGTNGDTNGDGSDNGGSTGGGLDDLTGDPAAGETVYAANGCTACHCEEAAGGCALSAPAIIDTAAQLLDDFLRGDEFHPTKIDLTDQEIVDLQAYLASL